MRDRDALVAAWSAKDRTRAVLPADREIVDASATVRALIVDLVLAAGPEDELYDAAAVLGRLIAQRGGSPTLASATLDHAADVLDARSSPWLVPARAAVAEGFAATLVEAAQLEAMRTWEFPSCAVPRPRPPPACGAPCSREANEPPRRCSTPSASWESK